MLTIGYGPSQTSIESTSSSVYQGYETVQTPEEYMAAPPMLMNGAEQQVALEGPVALAADACQSYPVLSAADLQQTLRQVKILDTKIAEQAGQLEVEHKMVEAASSLSKLHLEGQKSEKRMSRVFTHGEKAKRLSKQAEDEMEVSMKRIHDLESTILQLQYQRSQLELKIVRHRSALLAQSVLHDQISNSKMLGDLSERRIQGHSRTDSSQTMRAGSDGATVDIRDEMSILAMKIKSALPGTTFRDPADPSVVSMGVGILIKERNQLNQALLESQTEIAVHRNRAEQLSLQLKTPEKSLAAAEDSAERARLNAELLEARQNLDDEQRKSNQLRIRSENHRKELEKTVMSLEDVTRMAVSYENERTGLGEIITRLEERVKELESDKLDTQISTRLDSTSSIGILCREFRSILHEQQQKHWTELRRLRDSVVNNGRAVKDVQTPSSSSGDVSQQGFVKQTDYEPRSTSTPPRNSSKNDQHSQSYEAGSTVPQSPLNASPEQYAQQQYQQSPSKPRVPRSSYVRYEAQSEPVAPSSPVRVPEQIQVQSPLANNRMSRYTGHPSSSSKSHDDYDLL